MIGQIDQKNQSCLFYFLLLLAFALFMWTFWPGTLTPDSSGQMHEALTGSYSTHHPPMMAFYWRQLMKIYAGPGLMLMTHFALLWGSVAIFFNTFRHDFPKASYLFLIIPFWPAILSHVFYIWKDVALGTSFLCVCASLTFFTIRSRRPSNVVSLFLFALIVYGMSVKYQALYIGFLPLFWLIKVRFNPRIFQQLIATVLATFLAFMAKEGVERVLIGDVTESHSWQLARLYELATISLETNQQLFPDYIKQGPHYDFEKIRQIYKPISVDDLVFPKNSPLLTTKDGKDLKDLRQFWMKTLIDYPFIYLKCRYNLWKYNLKNSAAWDVNWEKDTIRQPLKFYIKKCMRSISKFLYGFILACAYIVFGFYAYRQTKNPYAYALILINVIALSLPFVLFLLSMAGTARYIYMSSCLVSFAHPMAWMCYQRVYATKPFKP